MLNKELNANPNENYLILQTAITDSIKTHLTKKVVKFNRKMHKRDPWTMDDLWHPKLCESEKSSYKKLMKINRDSLFLIPKKTRVQCL